MINNDEYILEY